MEYKNSDFQFFKNTKDQGMKPDNVFNDLIKNKFVETCHKNLPDNNP